MKELCICVHYELINYSIISVTKKKNYPKCPPIGRWLHESHYNHSMEFHIVVKKLHRVKRMKWECVCVNVYTYTHIGQCTYTHIYLYAFRV